jgi:hypothetical protein
MAFMFILTLFAGVFTGTHTTTDSDDYSTSQDPIQEGDNVTIDIPSADSQELNIWDTTGAMVILVIAISVGIIAGIKVLGSGLSDMSQNLIFNAILFLGLWAVLSIVSADFLFETTLVTLFWVTLTTIYIIGMGIHLNGSGATE